MISTTSTIGVCPTLPTIAGDLKYGTLAGNDLLIGVPFLMDLYYIPAIIDIERFKEALAKALSHFPQYAGRIRHEPHGEWRIQLTNSPIPLEIEIHECRDPRLDYDFAVFDSMEDISGLILPIDHDHVVNTNTALLTIKLSLHLATNESIIGIAASHIIADGYSTTQLGSSISAFYQGFTCPFPSPIFNPPTTFHVNKPLSPLKVTPEIQHKLVQSDMRLSIPHHFPPNILSAKYRSDKEETLPIRLRATKAQCERLKNHIMREMEALQGVQGSKIRLSSSDALAGLIVATINRFIPVPVEYVWSTVDTRPVVPPDAWSFSNIIVRPSRRILVDTAGSTVFSIYQQAARVALAIRLTLLDSRAPDSNLPTIFSISQTQFQAAADRGEIFTLLNPPGFAAVNSLAGFRFDETTNFGFPGRVKHWVSDSWDRYIRIFPSNPEFEPLSSSISGNERGVIDSRRGSLDAHFRVDKRWRDEVEAALKEVLEEGGLKADGHFLRDAKL